MFVRCPLNVILLTFVEWFNLSKYDLSCHLLIDMAMSTFVVNVNFNLILDGKVHLCL